jgi:hypothetical protein
MTLAITTSPGLNALRRNTELKLIESGKNVPGIEV